MSAYDHWIAFILLLYTGGKMVWEGISGEDEKALPEILWLISLVALSHATSIETLAVGVSCSLLGTAVLIPALIGMVCCGISFAGVILGEHREEFLGNKMEIVSGLFPM